MSMIVHPPGTGPRSTSPMVAHGRTYTPVPGTPQTVPDQDAARLCSNGWLYADGSSGGNEPLAGATAARPTTGLVPGMGFIDTTVGALLIWDGAAWRHHVTGGTP